MYTFGKAGGLKTHCNEHVHQDIIAELEAVKAEALAASIANARAVVHFFNVLETAMKSDDPELAKAASDIFHSSYNAEVA